MTFRYFYNGAYREAFVPAGGRIVLDIATVGAFDRRRACETVNPCCAANYCSKPNSGATISG